MMISEYEVGAVPVIVANKIDQQDYCITLGNFFNEKGVPFGGNNNPVSVLISFVASNVRRGPAISRYLYTSFTSKSIDLKKGPSIIFKSIDDFDIKKKKNTTIRDILITDNKNAIIAFHDLKTNALEFFHIHAN